MNQLMWIATAAVVIVGIVRALKSDGMTVALANLGLPPIPKRALPWVALFFGAASAVLDAKVVGTSWEEAAASGVLAAATAVLGHDLGKTVPGVRKVLGALLFVGVASSVTACTPQARWALAELLAKKIACGVAHQDLPNDDIIKLCALEPGDIPKVLEVVGKSRAAGAQHAADAAARAGAAKCVAP